MGALIGGIGWDTFFHLRMLVFIELVHEFYCTFFFDKSAMLTVHMFDIFSFWLLGHYFRMSMAEFISALGFDPQVLSCDFPLKFDVAFVYANLCDNPPDAYYPNKSKDLFLLLPEMPTHILGLFLLWSQGCLEYFNPNRTLLLMVHGV